MIFTDPGAVFAANLDRMMEDITKNFETEIKKSFDDFLKTYGFSLSRSDINENEITVVYRNGERYILIGGMFKPEEYPYYFYISLGEGDDKMPEADWNAVAFWKIMQSVSPDDYENFLHVFDVHAGIKEQEIADKVWGAKELCKECAWEFLEGHLDHFRSLRAEINRNREPYKIYVLDPNGKHRLTYEKESVKLREIYSQDTIDEKTDKTRKIAVAETQPMKSES